MLKRTPKRHPKKIYKANYQSPKGIALGDGTQLGNSSAFLFQQSFGVGMHLNWESKKGTVAERVTTLQPKAAPSTSLGMTVYKIGPSTSQSCRFASLGMTKFSKFKLYKTCHPDRPGCFAKRSNWRVEGPALSLSRTNSRSLNSARDDNSQTLHSAVSSSVSPSVRINSSARSASS